MRHTSYNLKITATVLSTRRVHDLKNQNKNHFQIISDLFTIINQLIKILINGGRPAGPAGSACGRTLTYTLLNLREIYKLTISYYCMNSISEKSRPATRWKLALVEQTFPDNYGAVRSVREKDVSMRL